jgi:molybdopterin-guanine dinucleotide biosynthesis protein A
VYDPEMFDVCAFILAGGRSTRMGTDKAFLDFEGQTLLGRALAVVRAVTPEVRILGPANRFSAYAATIEDQFPGQGPLAGIHAALAASLADRNLILAVDTPFVTAPLLSYLVDASCHSGATVTAPHLISGWQPLCAVYRPEFAPLAETALSGGRNKIDALFASTNVQAISERDLALHGFSTDLFLNLNTPEDLERAHAVRNF